MKLCYIAAADGVYTYSIAADGTLTLLDRLALDRPMYLTLDSGRLFCLLCDPENTGNSAVAPYYVDPQGLPIDPTPAVTTGGRVGCHLSVLDHVVYAANYSSGSIARMPLDGTPANIVTHEGRGIRPDRQEMPHTHFIAPMPEEEFLAVCDLGLDRVVIYDRALKYRSEARFPDGCGPRHLCYSPDGRYAYCANELSSTVSVLSCDGKNGSMTHLSHLSTRSDLHGENDNYPAAIRCDGRYVYVSNRGDDDIAVFRIDGDGEILTQTANLPTHGTWPRDLFVTEDLMICTNEHSDTVTVLKLSDDRTEAKLIQIVEDMPAPIAVLVV